MRGQPHLGHCLCRIPIIPAIVDYSVIGMEVGEETRNGNWYDRTDEETERKRPMEAGVRSVKILESGKKVVFPCGGRLQPLRKQKMSRTMGQRKVFIEIDRAR